jgi:thiamine pyrophosphate-dependent acetolactate synthase large subunit-like protein
MTYAEKNKEAVGARKTDWTQRKKEETKEERAEQSRIKREAREQKTQQRITHENTIVTCECGGTYQNYRKKRHDSSALHQRFMETHHPLGVPIPSHGDA